MTLAFLGEREPVEVIDALTSCLPPLPKIGPVGYFDDCLFLPTHTIRTCSWHVHLMTQNDSLSLTQKALQSHFVPEETRPFLPHVTIARMPFNKAAWQKAFTKLPLAGSAIHLYESVGNLRYKPIHSLPLILPFEEFEHTADMAYKVRALSLNDLYKTAAIALSFRYPAFLQFINPTATCSALDDVIRELNMMIAKADSEVGCPIKAVSYHGQIATEGDILEWEMIVDV